MSKTLQTRIQLKHDTEANWIIAGNNGFTPLAGEIIIYDTDNEHQNPRFKMGDGLTVINNLPWAAISPEEQITFNVVGTTLVVGNAATIPAAENYSF